MRLRAKVIGWSGFWLSLFIGGAPVQGADCVDETGGAKPPAQINEVRRAVEAYVRMTSLDSSQGPAPSAPPMPLGTYATGTCAGVDFLKAPAGTHCTNSEGGSFTVAFKMPGGAPVIRDNVSLDYWAIGHHCTNPTLHSCPGLTRYRLETTAEGERLRLQQRDPYDRTDEDADEYRGSFGSRGLAKSFQIDENGYSPRYPAYPTEGWDPRLEIPCTRLHSRVYPVGTVCRDEKGQGLTVASPMRNGTPVLKDEKSGLYLIRRSVCRAEKGACDSPGQSFRLEDGRFRQVKSSEAMKLVAASIRRLSEGFLSDTETLALGAESLANWDPQYDLGCDWVDLRTVPEGTTCLTRENRQFSVARKTARGGVVFRDHGDDAYWYATPLARFDHQGGIAKYVKETTSVGDRFVYLPSRYEERAQLMSDGLSEVISQMSLPKQGDLRLPNLDPLDPDFESDLGARAGLFRESSVDFKRNLTARASDGSLLLLSGSSKAPEWKQGERDRKVHGYTRVGEKGKVLAASEWTTSTLNGFAPGGGYGDRSVSVAHGVFRTADTGQLVFAEESEEPVTTPSGSKSFVKRLSMRAIHGEMRFRWFDCDFSSYQYRDLFEVLGVLSDGRQLVRSRCLENGKSGDQLRMIAPNPVVTHTNGNWSIDATQLTSAVLLRDGRVLAVRIRYDQAREESVTELVGLSAEGTVDSSYEPIALARVPVKPGYESYVRFWASFKQSPDGSWFLAVRGQEPSPYAVDSLRRSPDLLAALSTWRQQTAIFKLNGEGDPVARFGRPHTIAASKAAAVQCPIRDFTVDEKGAITFLCDYRNRNGDQYLAYRQGFASVGKLTPAGRLDLKAGVNGFRVQNWDFFAENSQLVDPKKPSERPRWKFYDENVGGDAVAIVAGKGSDTYLVSQGWLWEKGAGPAEMLAENKVPAVKERWVVQKLDAKLNLVPEFGVEDGRLELERMRWRDPVQVGSEPVFAEFAEGGFRFVDPVAPLPTLALETRYEIEAWVKKGLVWKTLGRLESAAKDLCVSRRYGSQAQCQVPLAKLQVDSGTQPGVDPGNQLKLQVRTLRSGDVVGVGTLVLEKTFGQKPADEMRAPKPVPISKNKKRKK